MTRRPRPQPRRAAPLAEGPPISIVDLARGLLPRMAGGDLASWGPWIAALKALFALPLDEAELALYRQHTGRRRQRGKVGSSWGGEAERA